MFAERLAIWQNPSVLGLFQWFFFNRFCEPLQRLQFFIERHYNSQCGIHGLSVWPPWNTQLPEPQSQRFRSLMPPAQPASVCTGLALCPEHPSSLFSLLLACSSSGHCSTVFCSACNPCSSPSSIHRSHPYAPPHFGFCVGASL